MFKMKIYPKSKIQNIFFVISGGWVGAWGCSRVACSDFIKCARNAPIFSSCFFFNGKNVVTGMAEVSNIINFEYFFRCRHVNLEHYIYVSSIIESHMQHAHVLSISYAMHPVFSTLLDHMFKIYLIVLWSCKTDSMYPTKEQTHKIYFISRDKTYETYFSAPQHNIYNCPQFLFSSYRE